MTRDEQRDHLRHDAKHNASGAHQTVTRDEHFPIVRSSKGKAATSSRSAAAAAAAGGDAAGRRDKQQVGPVVSGQTDKGPKLSELQEAVKLSKQAAEKRQAAVAPVMSKDKGVAPPTPPPPPPLPAAAAAAGGGTGVASNAAAGAAANGVSAAAGSCGAFAARKRGSQGLTIPINTLRSSGAPKPAKLARTTTTTTAGHPAATNTPARGAPAVEATAADAGGSSTAAAAAAAAAAAGMPQQYASSDMHSGWHQYNQGTFTPTGGSYSYTPTYTPSYGSHPHYHWQQQQYREGWQQHLPAGWQQHPSARGYPWWAQAPYAGQAAAAAPWGAAAAAPSAPYFCQTKGEGQVRRADGGVESLPRTVSPASC
jgi:hypothetical protein